MENEPAVMSDALSQITVRDYVCAGCWGHLSRFHYPDGVRVVCQACGDGRGFASKAYVNWRRQQDRFDASEVTAMLQSIGVLQKAAPRSGAEILADLGF
jgi:hypothetical protein